MPSSVERSSSPNSRAGAKIEALTSLRFFAAMAIVFHHVRGSFGVSPNLLRQVPLEQAVSFFFVLSGFILAYVYPTLESIGWRRFLIARVARIWPAHLAALALLFILLPQTILGPAGRFSLANLLGNVAMVQAWFPIGGRVFSYNSPSWSISTEFGFYLLFPILVHRWDRTWKLKLLAAAGLAAGMIALASSGFTRWSGLSLGIGDFVYTHPLARLFEFTVGMCAASVWRRLSARSSPSRSVATALEAAALALVGVAVLASPILSPSVGSIAGIGPAFALWLVRGGLTCAPFAILIVVIALRAGWIARLLSAPILVLLGETSYSIYLIHYFLLKAANDHAPYLSRIPTPLLLWLYLLVVLSVSYLIWFLVELPARKALVRLWDAKSRPGPSPVATPASGLGHLLFHRAIPALIGIALVLVGGGIVAWYYGAGLDRIDDRVAESIAATGDQAARGARFEDRFELVGARIQEEGEWLRIELVWRSLRAQPLDLRVAVHLTDALGKIRAQADYSQSIAGGAVEKGAIWRERTLVQRVGLDEAKSVGVGLYNRRQLLAIDRGPRDWNDKRLVLPLPRRADG